MRSLTFLLALLLVTLTSATGDAAEPEPAKPKSKQAPEFAEIGAWINSEPLTMKELKGKVVVIHFWAFGCINCINNLPHYQAWQKDFAGEDLLIVGIHTPETDAERQLDNLRENVKQREIAYPVAFDDKGTMWKAWGTRYWPSVALVDRKGEVRHVWEGELNWKGNNGEEQMRAHIKKLIAEKAAN